MFLNKFCISVLWVEGRLWLKDYWIAHEVGWQILFEYCGKLDGFTFHPIPAWPLLFTKLLSKTFLFKDTSTK